MNRSCWYILSKFEQVFRHGIRILSLCFHVTEMHYALLWLEFLRSWPKKLLSAVQVSYFTFFYILWYELYVYIFYAFTAAVIDTDSGFLAGTFTDYIDGARIYLEAPEVGQSNTERWIYIFTSFNSLNLSYDIFWFHEISSSSFSVSKKSKFISPPLFVNSSEASILNREEICWKKIWDEICFIYLLLGLENLAIPLKNQLLLIG